MSQGLDGRARLAHHVEDRAAQIQTGEERGRRVGVGVVQDVQAGAAAASARAVLVPVREEERVPDGGRAKRRPADPRDNHVGGGRPRQGGRRAGGALHEALIVRQVQEAEVAARPPVAHHVQSAPEALREVARRQQPGGGRAAAGQGVREHVAVVDDRPGGVGGAGHSIVTERPSYAGLTSGGRRSRSSLCRTLWVRCVREGAARPDRACDPDGLFDVEVVRVRATPPKRVHHQRVHAVQHPLRPLGHALGVGDVAERADAEAVGEAGAVRHAEGSHLGSERLDGHVLAVPVQVDVRSRRPPGPGSVPQKDVGEAGPHLADELFGQMRRDRAAASGREDADVVDAVDMVGVEVGVPHRVHVPCACGKELKAQLRGGVDQQPAFAEVEEGAVAGAAVAGVVRRARRAVAADHGDAVRRAGAQEGQPHGGLTGAPPAWCSWIRGGGRAAPTSR